MGNRRMAGDKGKDWVVLMYVFGGKQQHLDRLIAWFTKLK